MGSVSGTSSEEDLKQLMEQRKRKRTISNRESARRSRMKKQKLTDDLTAEVARLRNENRRIITSINVTNQLCFEIEGENLVLRAQVAELDQGLESLNGIISLLNSGNDCFALENTDGFMNNSWDCMYLNEPIMASADMLLQY